MINKNNCTSTQVVPNKPIIQSQQVKTYDSKQSDKGTINMKTNTIIIPSGPVLQLHQVKICYSQQLNLVQSSTIKSKQS